MNKNKHARTLTKIDCLVTFRTLRCHGLDFSMLIVYFLLILILEACRNAILSLPLSRKCSFSLKPGASLSQSAALYLHRPSLSLRCLAPTLPISRTCSSAPGSVIVWEFSQRHLRGLFLFLPPSFSSTLFSKSSAETSTRMDNLPFHYE